MNLTAFYDPYNNAQIQLQDFVEYKGAPTNLTAVLNAGKQINEGLEFESVWKPIRPLTLSLNVGYLDSYYKNFLINCAIFTFQAGCGPGVGVVNIADENRPLNAPFWSVSENTTYTWDLRSGTLLARVGYDWRSFSNVAVYTPSPTEQPAYGLLNAGLAFTTTSKAWRFSIDGKNLTDRYYRVAGYDFGNPPIARCQFLHRRREPDRFLWSAAHGDRDGDLPLLTHAQRRRGERTKRFAQRPALRPRAEYVVVRSAHSAGAGSDPTEWPLARRSAGAHRWDGRAHVAEFAAATARVANGLAGLGVRPRERVAVLMESRLETVLALFGIVRAGAVAVPLNVSINDSAVAAMCADAGCVAVFASGSQCARIDALRAAGALGARHFIGCDAPARGWRDFQAFIAGAECGRARGGDCTGR